MPHSYFVSNLLDNAGVDPNPGDGTGTLRQAIVDSNANGGNNTIQFTTSTADGAVNFASGVNTIGVGAALPAITDSLTISGPAAATSVSWSTAPAPGYGLFSVSTGSIAFSNFTDSESPRSPAAGGGAINVGEQTATLNNMILADNTCSGTTGSRPPSAGAVFVDYGSVTINNSTLIGNSSAYLGGAIGIGGGGTITSTGCIFGGTDAGTRTLPARGELSAASAAAITSSRIALSRETPRRARIPAAARATSSAARCKCRTARSLRQPRRRPTMATPFSSIR